MNLKVNMMTELENKINQKPELKPIYTNDIYKEINEEYPMLTKQVFNTYMTRLLERDEMLQRHKKGVYYKTVKTPFGKAKIDKGDLIKDRYLYNKNEVIGYETGPTFMQKVGLTTQISNTTYIATEKVKNNRREKDKNLYLLKPRIKINKENYKYLQMLDIIENKYKVSIEVDDPKNYYKKLIDKFNIDIVKLTALATRYNNVKLVNCVAQLLREIKYEDTLC